MDNTGARLKQLSPEQRKLLEHLRASQNVIPRAPKNGPMPLSFAQQRLWFVDRLEPASIVYNVPLAVRIKGNLNAPAFVRAFSEVVRRHEVLRTHFEERNGEPVQVVDSASCTRLEEVDLSTLPEPDCSVKVRRLADEYATAPFDLARGPLLRAALLRIDPNQHVLLVTMHHIVADGWSGGLLMRELGALYQAFSLGQPSPLSQPPIQYCDYAVWQRATLDRGALEDQLAYWRSKLAGVPVLEFPCDRPRPAVPSRNGATVPVFIPSAIIDPLRRLCLAENLTMFMALLGSFQALLSRWTGQLDFAIGTTVANRPRAELENMIGCFVNQLVLRTTLERDPTTRESFRRVRDTCLEAQVHQDVPFERIVEAMNPGRALTQAPLFQVTFLLQNVPLGAMNLRDLTLEPLERSGQVASLDFSVLIAEARGAVEGVIQFATDLFDARTIERLAAHWVLLLQGMVATPDARISELSFLPEAERFALLEEWNRTEAHYTVHPQLHGEFEKQAATTPDRVALISEEGQLSYAELNARANQLAWRLLSLGVGPEARVAVCLERSLNMVIALLAVEKAGAAYVPLDPGYPAERLAFMLADAQPAVLVSHRGLCSDLPSTAVRLDLDACRATLETHPQDNLNPPVLSANAAYVIYTSGSTGQPKGAVNTHSGIVNRLEWMQQAYALSEADRVLQKTTYSFDVSVWEFFWPLRTGAALILAAPGKQSDPGYLVEAIQRHQITVLHFVPSVLRNFLAEPGVGTLTTLRHVMCSGESLPPELVQRFSELSHSRLHNLYGPTEASIDVTSWECHAGASLGSRVPIGRPIANTRIYVLDREGMPTPLRVRGEIYLAGAGLARGYWNRPGLTAERFVPDPFDVGARLYRSGDLGRWCNDGVLEYLGRADQQIKLRGLRIEPGEIECALREQQGIREAVVILREDVPDDPRLVAYLETEDRALDVARLRSALSSKLPRYNIPSQFVCLAAFPLSPNGKLDRAALPPPANGTSLSLRQHQGPRGPVERTLAALWTTLLGVSNPSVYDNFFELGGHSLLLTQLASRIQAEFGFELSLRQLFDLPTISEIAEELARASLEQLGKESGAALLDELSRLSPEQLRTILEQERALGNA